MSSLIPKCSLHGNIFREDLINDFRLSYWNMFINDTTILICEEEVQYINWDNYPDPDGDKENEPLAPPQHLSMLPEHEGRKLFSGSVSSDDREQADEDPSDVPSNMDLWNLERHSGWLSHDAQAVHDRTIGTRNQSGI